jgi:hypothetical protein
VDLKPELTPDGAVRNPSQATMDVSVDRGLILQIVFRVLGFVQLFVQLFLL